MGLKALAGAVGFLTRLPAGRDADAWDAFAATPAAFLPVGYLLGGVAALALAIPAPDPARAFCYVAAVYALTGINHVDGLADLGDAAVVHGDTERRREVMKDTTVGVGAVLAVALVVAGLALAALALAGITLLAAVGIVVAAEVGAKFGMAALACLGAPAHEGLGSQFTADNGARSLVPSALLALPALALTWPSLAATGAVAGALLAAGAVGRWSDRALGGAGGDAFGATNELGRLAGLYGGLIAWELFPEVIAWTPS
ncbi:cobalamin-5'-phosphate synthase [Natronoarchaeum philippinense]|uniref:Adenosylcobinamide-GDP ribazoletransferase n=1 Tax=Natronoarchaeum philippinense TaxID=558529 RepID=A0A285NT17_NATPI|nr:adenosylcobinamide-GDP ribazoletransferase [Natronoarchaeum philippinense]SNZ12599.1 cobalamin-5'-phosphate synthase [Natronoarchaeum philippinense]